MIRRTAILFALLSALVVAPAARADFGIVPGSTEITALNRDGTIATQAGSHPYSFVLSFDLKTNADGTTEGGEMRDVLTDLPPGLIGNPQAVESCSQQDFEGGQPQCPPSSQVGFLRVILPGLKTEAFGPIYNLTPPPGLPAQFGFSAVGFTAILSATLRSEDDYGIHIETPNAPLEVSSVTATIWGNPADDSHDPQRGPDGGETTDAPVLPFLTLPTSCEAPPEATVAVSSKLAPGLFVSETALMRDKVGDPLALSGCEAVPFSPQLLVGPSSSAAESATGLGFQLKLPNQGLLNPKEGAVSETEPEAMVLRLPAGLTANPAAVNGQGVCSPADYKAAKAASGPSQGCPESSKLGTLIASSPLLEEAIEGSVYLATPHDNPFDSLLALYIVARAPERGALVKQAVEVRPDPLTGQLTSIVEGLPPIPYSSFEVRLREGPRAPLITPQTCGTYTTTASLFSFAQPETEVVRSSPFSIGSGSGGAPCAQSEPQLPFAPALSAGVTAPLAGAYSPFLTKLTREDGMQHFENLTATLPPGVTAKLAGVDQCSEAQLAAAEARKSFGEGALEARSPSCPANSQVGVVNVGAGAGPTPYYVQGKAYLAGPYKGAPVSLAIVTPAVAGPFDLGVVVVRSGLYVNEQNAQVTVKSDDVPQILEGFPLAIRSVAVQVDRTQFTLNPTSCEPMSIAVSATSTTGQVAPLANRFQVGSCKGLGFKPSLKIQFKGRSNRRAHPRVIATLTAKPGEANTSFAQVKLPKAAFLDNDHIGTVCTRVQFAAESCPAASIYGRAEATTPLLGYPLAGTVYLRSSSNPLPDLVVAFKGPPSQPIKFDLAGKTDAVNGALRNTFQTTPDVPVSKFRLELFGGKKGLIILSDGLCKHRAATVKLRAHNGKQFFAKPKVKASCGKGRGN